MPVGSVRSAAPRRPVRFSGTASVSQGEVLTIYDVRDRGSGQRSPEVRLDECGSGSVVRAPPPLALGGGGGSADYDFSHSPAARHLATAGIGRIPASYKRTRTRSACPHPTSLFLASRLACAPFDRYASGSSSQIRELVALPAKTSYGDHRARSPLRTTPREPSSTAKTTLTPRPHLRCQIPQYLC